MSSDDQKDEFLTGTEFDAWHGCLTFMTGAMAALDRALGAAHGISLKEFDVLITLFNAPNGRLRMTALAESVVLTASGLTQLVTRLELRGLIARDVDEGDRRSFLTTLTAAGHRRLRESRPTHNEVIRSRLTRPLSENQLKQLGAIWKAVARANAEHDARSAAVTSSQRSPSR